MTDGWMHDECMMGAWMNARTDAWMDAWMHGCKPCTVNIFCIDANWIQTGQMDGRMHDGSVNLRPPNQSHTTGGVGGVRVRSKVILFACKAAGHTPQLFNTAIPSTPPPHQEAFSPGVRMSMPSSRKTGIAPEVDTHSHTYLPCTYPKKHLHTYPDTHLHVRPNAHFDTYPNTHLHTHANTHFDTYPKTHLHTHPNAHFHTYPDITAFLTRCAHVLSMPRLRKMGLAPDVTYCRPYRTISRASTLAVVVPSPAESLVRPAT
eukprot:351086-Chlamydomonas_euryale.AAC.3